MPDGYGQLTISGDLTDDQRAQAERSVQAHIAAVTEARTKQRAAEAALAQSSASVQAPLVRLIEDDPDAAKALGEVSERRRDLMRVLDVEPPPVPRTRDLHLDVVTLADDGVADQILVTPYNFAWDWHTGAGGSTTADRTTGEISVGTMVDDVDFSDVHAGVGVFLTTNAPRPVAARSLRSSAESYTVVAGGFGGVALAEGGMEMTFLEDGQLKSLAQEKRYRRRVSNGEVRQWDSGGFGTGAGIEVVALMLPGRGYTLNVGAWVYCHQEGGFGVGGDSWAVSKINAKVIFMSLFDQ